MTDDDRRALAALAAELRTDRGPRSYLLDVRPDHDVGQAIAALRERRARERAVPPASSPAHGNRTA